MIERGTLLNYVGGKWQASSATEKLPILNPATAELLVAAPISPAEDVNKAVDAAREALVTWRRTPPGDRIQPLFRLKALLDTHFNELARVITVGALLRNESRGAHYKPEFPERDDAAFLKTTRAVWSADGPVIGYEPVDTSLIPPRKRVYTSPGGDKGREGEHATGSQAPGAPAGRPR